jgi:2-(1,2-epoxy-1,2-dihydrophenyl)acetyl-CoA isomerase
MSSERPITTTIEDGVATVTFDNDGGVNVMTARWGRCFKEDVAAIVSDATVRVIVLRAEGKTFCVGGDINGFATADDTHAAVWSLADELHTGLLQLAVLEAPVVASVQGVAAGAGMSLVCAADLAFAGESAAFTAAYTAAGLSPDGGMSWWLPRLVGERRASELLLTNRLVGAREAAEIGLVTATVPDDELTARVTEVVARLAAGSRAAHGATRRLLRSAATSTLEAQLALEADSIATLAASPAGQEGLSAFLEKRRPNFPR